MKRTLVETILQLMDVGFIYRTPSATDLHAYFVVDDLLCRCVELVWSSMFSLRSVILSPGYTFTLRGGQGEPPYFRPYQAFNELSFLFFSPCSSAFLKARHLHDFIASRLELGSGIHKSDDRGTTFTLLPSEHSLQLFAPSDAHYML